MSKSRSVTDVVSVNGQRTWLCVWR